MKIVEEEEEEVADIQPDPLHQLILHFSHNALTERRWVEVTVDMHLYCHISFNVLFERQKYDERWKMFHMFGFCVVYLKCAAFSFLIKINPVLITSGIR